MIKSLSGVTVAAVTLALSAPIAAQGIPDRVQALEGAVTALQADVKTLQGTNSTLQTQISGLQGQVSGLQNRVSVLESSNTAVQTRIGTIQNQVSGLQNQQTVLDAKVQGLQGQGQVFVAQSPVVGPLPGAGVFGVVGGLRVPAGTYLIHAIVATMNNDMDDQSGECFLSTVPGHQGTNFNPGTAADALARIHGNGNGVPGGNGDKWFVQIPLFDVATFGSDTNIYMYCSGFSWFARSTIVAVSIGGIH